MAKKSGSAESGIPIGQGKIKMEVKRRNSEIKMMNDARKRSMMASSSTI